MLSALSLVLFAIFFNENTQAALPSYIHPCEYDSSTLSVCIQKEIEGALPYFTKGIPELGVPSIDPLRLDDINIDGNGLKLAFTQTTLHGLSKSQLTNFKLDVDKKEETFSLTFKTNITLIAKYVIDGRILVLPIQGDGDAKVHARNVEVQIDSTLSHIKDGKGEHFKLITPSYKYNIENTRFEFDNLFNGNKQLSDATHQFANENWQQLMDDLGPPVIKQFVRTCVKAINKFFSNVTIQQITRGYKG